MIFPQHPVYVPSRGRYHPNRALTQRALHRDRVPCYVVVEPHEADLYEFFAAPEAQVLVLPEDDFGILRVRQWCWEHAEAMGHAKHHQLDDNLIEFRRLWKGRRIPCHAGVALRVVEDLSDRYENVGIAGLNYQMFVPADTPTPVYWNVHVYSACLFDHAMSCRHRLACNEDVDICLRALATGWCTLATNAFMVNKLRTMAMEGGNTDRYLDRPMTNVVAPYRAEEDGEERELGFGTDSKERFEQTRLLERAWPGLVKTTRRFGRYQHVVDWRKFKDNPKPRLREGVDLSSLPSFDEYGMTLRKVKEIRSPALRKIFEEF